jgi:TRAP-type C4-dicarboxylate transport system permease small subunit
MSTGRYLLTFRWASATSQVTGYLSAIALLLATAATMYGVALRYFLGRPTVWQTEFSIYLLMFVTFVGGAYGLRHHAHVGVDLIVDSVPGRGRLVMRLVAALLSLIVVLIVFWTAAEMWWEAYQGGWTTSTTWGPPLSVVYAILPVGMLFVACQYVAFIIEGFLGLFGKLDDDEVSLLKQENPELHSAAVIEAQSLEPGGDVDGPPARSGPDRNR